MSRYADLPPYMPGAEYKVVRALTLAGRTYSFGETIDRSGLDDRLLRRLYEQRRIVPDASAPAKRRDPLDHDGDGRRGGSLPRAQRAAAASEALAAPTTATEPESAPQAAPTAPAAYRIKHAGLGGYKVIDASGAPIGKGFKTKEEAQAEIERLQAL